MKPTLNLVTVILLASTLVACSGDDDSGSSSTAGDVDGSGGDSGGGNGGSSGGGSDAGGAPVDDEPGDRIPSSDGLPEPTPSTEDTVTGPLLAPSGDDFFFTQLELDPEEAIPGGPPTTPKNLRIDLVSNDWAEFNWAPSNDDGEVVAYLIQRSDGHVYTVRDETRTDVSPGTQRAIDRFWRTTSFIDCNYTRFTDVVHDCTAQRPSPGDTFTYTVTAVDDEGQQSPPSNPITIHYHERIGAPVADVEDPYLGTTKFALENDVTNTAYFLDKFTLMFEDEFNGDSIDENLWNTELVWGDTRIINGEQQYFVSTQRDDALAAGYDPFRFNGSTMTIEANPTPPELEAELPPICSEEDPRGFPRCTFLSGALSTHDKLHMTYGYVESRMRVSGKRGALSSFYIQSRFEGEGRNFHAPEIDILEYLGENPFGDEDAFQNYHFGDAAAHVETGERITRRSPTMNHEKPEGDLYSDDFHTYGVLWEPQLVIWYIDGVEVRRLSGVQVGRQAMNIVLYLVAGSGWAPTPDVDDPDLFPIELEIDWVRAWQRGNYRENGLYPARD